MKKTKVDIKKRKRMKITDKIAICLLAFQPKIELIELYDGLYRGDKYDIYVIVDDNNYDINELEERFSDIRFIKVKEDTCKKSGYQNLNYMVKDGEPSAWDKSIYYFCEVNHDLYSYVWFLEDDVFVPTSETIKNIDEKYGNEDILLKSLQQGKNILYIGPQNQELKKYMNPIFQKYLTKSMVCAIRLSNQFIQKIREYIKKYKSFFFLEYFFPTLANYYGLKVKTIDELKNIIFRKIWTVDDIFKEQNSLFHPVKDTMLQRSFRKTLEPNQVYFTLKRIFKNRLLENKDVKLKNMHMIQRVIFKNENGNEIHVIVDSSIEETNLYLEVYKKYKNHKFSFKIQIQSMEEIKSLLSVLKYNFIAFQTLIQEHFIYDENVNIYLVNIPGVIEFVEFESHSKDKLKEAYEKLGYTEGEIKDLEEVVKESDEFFGTKTDFNESIEYVKIDKAVKYIKKNKEVFTKLIEKQKKLYKNILELFGRKVKVYDKLMFMTEK